MDTKDYLQKLRADIVFEQTLRGHPFTFHSTWGLFSPREIDEGTRLLLKHIKVNPDSDCLDFGCGYGPIGIAMARMAPEGQVLMTDKDFVAVEYSNKNIQANRIQNADVMLSNGFNQIPADMTFDIIVSNIPAKVGKEFLTLLLNDARARLNPGGKIYVVTINGLRQFMRRYLDEIFGNYKKIKQGATYTVAMASLPE